MTTNELQIGEAVVQTNDLEMQFLKLDQVRGLLETLGTAVFYGKEDISEANVYHSLNIAAEEVERIKEELYNLVFNEDIDS